MRGSRTPAHPGQLAISTPPAAPVRHAYPCFLLVVHCTQGFWSFRSLCVSNILYNTGRRGGQTNDSDPTTCPAPDCGTSPDPRPAVSALPVRFLVRVIAEWTRPRGYHCEQQSVRHRGIIVTAACATARLHPRASRLEFGRTPVVQSAIVTGVERHRATAALDACTSSKACFGGRGPSSGCARCVPSHRLRASMLRGAAASAAAPVLPSSGPSRAQVARLEWCPHHTQLFTSTNLPIPPGDQHRSVIPGRSTLELFPARPGFF
ncbi:hypothetical protein OH76DRAFT_279592 [Lentinus brumalis]|uniref:Uncharacterized protein n=1 Tax=Lentinus brumalis TaxID=2498619 RepID=A0A371CKX8_9APHY|nr:hypothetical protein OH76DRAFT_279592 [Polyporus brumalis]